MLTISELGLESYLISDLEIVIEAMRGDCIKRPPTLYERMGG